MRKKYTSLEKHLDLVALGTVADIAPQKGENRIFTKDWSLYDGTHVVFSPKKLHPLELQEKFLWAWKKFYSLWRKPHLYGACRYVINRWNKANEKTLADLKKRFGSASEGPPFHKANDS